MFILAIQKIGFGIFGPKMGVHFHKHLIYKSLQSPDFQENWVCFAYFGQFD